MSCNFVNVFTKFNMVDDNTNNGFQLVINHDNIMASNGRSCL